MLIYPLVRAKNMIFIMMNQVEEKSPAGGTSKVISNIVTRKTVRAKLAILIVMLLRSIAGTPPAYLPTVSKRLNIVCTKRKCQLG